MTAFLTTMSEVAIVTLRTSARRFVIGLSCSVTITLRWSCSPKHLMLIRNLETLPIPCTCSGILPGYLLSERKSRSLFLLTITEMTAVSLTSISTLSRLYSFFLVPELLLLFRTGRSILIHLKLRSFSVLNTNRQYINVMTFPNFLRLMSRSLILPMRGRRIRLVQPEGC